MKQDASNAGDDVVRRGGTNRFRPDPARRWPRSCDHHSGPGNVTHATTVEVAPNAAADPAAATAVATKGQTGKNLKAKKKDDTANMQPDDPRKSPYWEPRDWNYISQQGS
jgi:hypothetical protein